MRCNRTLLLRPFYDLCTIVHRLLQQFRNDRFRRYAFGFGAEVWENAMPQDRIDYGAHIIKAYGEAPVKESACLRAQDQSLACARPCAPAHILVDERARLFRIRAARAHKLCGKAYDVRCSRNVAHDLLNSQKRCSVEERTNSSRAICSSLRYDAF